MEVTIGQTKEVEDFQKGLAEKSANTGKEGEPSEGARPSERERKGGEEKVDSARRRSRVRLHYYKMGGEGRSQVSRSETHLVIKIGIMEGKY